MRRITSSSRAESLSSSSSAMSAGAVPKASSTKPAYRPRREDSVAARNGGIWCPCDLRPRNRLGDVAARAGTDHGNDGLLGRVRHAERQELGWFPEAPREPAHDFAPSPAQAARQVDVQQHDFRAPGSDDGDCLFHGAGLPLDGDVRVQVRLQPGAEDGVVIHDHHPDPGRISLNSLSWCGLSWCWAGHGLASSSVLLAAAAAVPADAAARGSRSRTSVPSGLLMMAAVPP